MSFREVNRLRKNGQLEEALTMANADLENEKSQWTCRALFWVLHDKCKQCIENGQEDEAQHLWGRMNEIMPSMEEDDGSPAVRQLGLLQQRLSPAAGIIRQADQDSRDSHKVARAFESVKDMVDDDALELSGYQQATVGWIVYRYAKHELEAKSTLNVRRSLALYFKLDVEKPSILHSSIMRLAVELESLSKSDFKFTRFLEMWGMNYFMDEDWQQFMTDDGKKLPSLVEKAIGRYCKELVDDHIGTVPDAFEHLMESARNKLANDPKVELNYARMLVAKGEVNRAIDAYRTVTRLLPQAYVWDELSDVVADRGLRRAILCKIITMQHDEKFLGDVRLRLAKLLIEDGIFASAEFELDAYKRARLANGWSVKEPYHQLRGQIPANTPACAGNQGLYADSLERLVAFMYPDAKTAVMFYDGKTFTNKNGKKRARLMMPNGDSMQIAPAKLPRNLARQDFCFFTVKYAETNRKKVLLAIAPIDAQEGMASFKIVGGNVKIGTNREGKAYGFVGDCYVNQSLLKGVADGAHLRVIAVEGGDNRQKAIFIL